MHHCLKIMDINIISYSISYRYCLILSEISLYLLVLDVSSLIYIIADYIPTYKFKKCVPMIIFNCYIHLFLFVLVDWSGKIYQTNAALEKENLMFCYECNTMVNGKSCSDFTDKDEYLRFSTKCTGDRKTCMVNNYNIILYYYNDLNFQIGWMPLAV